MKIYTLQEVVRHNRIDTTDQGLSRPLKLLIMFKMVILLLAVSVFSVTARTYAQTVTIHEKSVTLPQLFNIINQQTGYAFVVDNALIARTVAVSVHFDDTELTEVLDKTVKAQGFTYTIKHNTIVLKKNEVQPRVSGTVTDQDGKALPNVTVRIKGTQLTVITDEAGNYVFHRMLTGTETLVFSFIGYAAKEEPLEGRTVVNVRLTTTVGELESVVVTGLYARPIENFTGAATTVKGDQLRSVNMMNVFDAIKVFDPAIRLADNLEFGSDPNRLPQISIRGTNNFPVQQGEAGALPASGADFMAAYTTNPSMPLFILDGFEVSMQRLNDLDINRIDKITILKDAVATSAYGSRAANGVIVIETKQPQPGKLTVSYNSTIQLTGPDLTSYHLLNAADKLALEKAGGVYNGGTNPEFQRQRDEVYARRIREVEKGVDTYWLAQPLQNGWGTKQSVMVEGGDAFLRYGASFGYTSNSGAMKGSARQNYEGGMLIAYRKNNFMVRNQLTVNSNRADNSAYGSFSQYSVLNPYWSPYDENGNVRKVLDEFSTPGYAGITQPTNPMYNATLGTADYSKYIGFINNTFLEYRAARGLRLTGKFGLTRQEDESHRFLPADHTDFATISDYNSDDYFTRGSYTKGNGGFIAYEGSATGDYNRNFGNHMLYATLGVAIAEQRSNTTSLIVRGFPNARLDELYFGKEYLRDSRPTGVNDVTRRTSAFASVNYTYDRRYLVDFSWNLDGSTQFGADNRFAPFWAVGAGWNLHEEAFMASLSQGAITRLKLRAGVGTTGSQQFSPYMAVSTYQYNNGQDYTGMFGATLMTFGNTALKWQQTMKYSAGADVSLWRDRITLRLDGYREITNDLLLDINTPPSLGVSTYKQNVGKLENLGLEANVNAFLIRNERKSIYLSVFANGIHNRNSIREIANSLQKLNERNDGAGEDESLQTRPQLRFVEGQSVNAIWAVRSAGIDPSNGQELFYTRDGRLTYTWNAADKVIVGDAIPDLSGNFGANFSYKGIQLAAFMTYQLGGTLYNQTLADRIENADIRYNVDERVLLGRWQQPGDQTFFKGLTDVEGETVTALTQSTSRFLQRNNFIDLGSISVGYLFADRLTARWRLSNTRVNLMVNNLARLSTIQVERGLSYPFARNYTLNISTSF